MKPRVTASFNCRPGGATWRRETGWGATGGECVARRLTTPFRRDGAASLRLLGEALRGAQAVMAIKALSAPSSDWDRDALRAGRSERKDLSGVVGPRGVSARIVPHRPVPRGSRRESEGQQTPGGGKIRYG